MTRNFKQHGRDDERPYSRHYSDRQEGEQSPRPARPRLNRASVDRAWENGARQQHPDYHPRGERNTRNDRPRQQGQPYPANRRQSAPDDASSSPNSRSYHQPSFQRRENRQFDDRPPRRYDDRQPRRYDDRPPRRYEGPRSFDANQGQRAPGGRPYGERPRYSRDSEQRSPYQERRPSYRDQERDTRSRPYPARRDDTRDGRSPGTGGFNRSSRGYEQDRRYQREDRRPQTGPERNPRFQSRPERFSRSTSSTHGAREDELFEGDYERFNAANTRNHAPTDEELHVTHLPDGRVLRGTRKEQREAAAFWTDVDKQTEELIPDAEADEVNHPPEKPIRAKRAASSTAGKKDTGAAQTSRTPKEAKATGKRAAGEKGESRARKTPAKPKSSKPTANKTHPSQRGYKWPKPE